ncbi:[FeFe] hydrogenase H-cluster maturation GTPase HydF [Propionispira raffinosivorans]|uniref:[FeFe] hydrogenase H-cluster maturation GTPase HydF n=1 Tax=Propionispira raffinosivorans TaxID=86959 RepID=UPI00037D36F7|nr:[FeFe] hydrogenase H-cluster maturation GTPase HydF [Propionispira raffinosivorans]
MSLTDTPRANRLHIGLFGKRNSGKSSLVNALTNQNIALVSEVAGTTTDPVYKSMEIYGIGPCVFIDTAGFDDSGDLGTMRVEKTKLAREKTDIALVLFSDVDLVEELQWIAHFKHVKTPVVAIINKADILADRIDELKKVIKKNSGLDPIVVSAKEKQGIAKIREEIIRLLPEDYEIKSITGDLAKTGDTVLLVMPQDIQAPKGRLILPQVQTLRDLLDKKCLVMSATTDKLDEALAAMKNPPNLIITDSQVFKTVYDKKPKESKLTSFSVLFANYKGDIKFFTESAKSIDSLTEASHVLIAEACTHAPLKEDIGREKLPRLLRAKIGEKLNITVVSGTDFPDDLSGYDLVIQCGACMFNRKYVLSRAEKARSQNVPMSNYGVVLAYLSGILDKIDF